MFDREGGKWVGLDEICPWFDRTFYCKGSSIVLLQQKGQKKTSK